MKKFLSLVLLGTFVLGLSGCVQIEDEGTEVDCDLYPTHVDCLEDVDPDDPDAPGIVNVLDELPDEEITITFWHVYGQDKGLLLQRYIDDFEAMYPNVTIEATAQGGYDDLRNKTILSISAGETPTMLVGYPDHVAGYLNGNAVIPLDDFIKDETFGIDMTDFIDSYVDENKQYQGGYMYSLPYSKSTEMVTINKTFFTENGLEVKTDEPYTWAELETLADTLVGPGENQCDYLINFDSSSNFFINSVRQWQGGYTNSDGDILVDNANTKAMLTYVKARFEDKTFALPLTWEYDYGSTAFINGESCMTVGSTAGISYNTNGNPYEMAVGPTPQYDMDSKSAVQQGPNIAIMSDTTDAERLAAWLFITHVTNAENTARWSILTGYLPVRKSGYESPMYKFFLGINDINPTTLDGFITDYIDNEVIDSEIADMIAYYEGNKVEITEDYLDNDADGTEFDIIKSVYTNMIDYKYESMAANAAFLQVDYFEYDPAFAGRTSSSGARVQAGLAMESLLVGTATVDQAIEDMLYQLNAD